MGLNGIVAKLIGFQSECGKKDRDKSVCGKINKALIKMLKRVWVYKELGKNPRA